MEQFIGDTKMTKTGCCYSKVLTVNLQTCFNIQENTYPPLSYLNEFKFPTKDWSNLRGQIKYHMIEIISTWIYIIADFRKRYSSKLDLKLIFLLTIPNKKVALTYV